MADGFSFEEAQTSATPGGDPGGGFSFEEALGTATPVATPETSQALKETDALGVRGGPAQGPLGRFFGLKDPMIGPEGKIRPDITAPMASYQESVKDKGFSPLMGELGETAARMETLPVAIGIQALPPEHPVRQTVEGYYNAVRGMATSLSEEDNLALMTATAGLGGPAASAASRMGGRLLSGAFAAQIASAVPDQWKAFKEAPDLKTKTSMALQMLGSLGLVGAAGKHALMGERVTPPLEPDATIPTEEPFKRPPEEEVQTTMARPVKGAEVFPEETDAQAESRMLKARTRLEQLGGDWKEVHKRMVAETGQNPTFPEFANELEDEIKDLEKSKGKEAVPKGEAAAPESEEDAQNRYNEVYDRLAILHGHEGVADKAIKAAQAKSKTPLSMSEMADALEAEREKVPADIRTQSEETGIPAVRFAQAKRIGNALRQKYIDAIAILKARGAKPPEGDVEFPQYKVTPEPGGGFKVTRLPRKSFETSFIGATAKRQVVEKVLPSQDFFLPKEGGELQPYASREPSTEKMVLRDKGGGVVPKAPLRQQGPPAGAQAGAQPKPAAERPVAPEAPPPKAEPPRLVVEDLFDPKTKKRKGSIVKNQTTGEVVARFPSPERNPNAADLADTKAQAEAKAREMAGEPEPAKPEAAPPKPKTFRTTVVFDEFGNSPETPVANYVTSTGGILSKSAAKEQGRFKGAEDQWADPAKLSHPTHNKIFKPDGETPDTMAQNLYGEGLIKDPYVGTMNRALEEESAYVRSKAKRGEVSPQEQAAKPQMKQAEAFGKGQKTEQEGGDATAIPADSLNVGDVVTVDSTPLKVTDISPDDGTVTLEDGKRYGVQQVSGGDVIYGEVAETAPTEGAGEDVGTIGQKALNTADSDPAAARKIAFKREGDHHVHKGTGLIVRYNKEQHLFEVVHPETGEVLDTGATRRATLDAHLDGLFKKESPPTTAEGEPEYDFSTISGFEKAIKDRFKRDVTDAERKAFQPIVEQINDAKAAVQKEGAKAINKILDHFKGVKDIPFSEAVKKIQDAIDKATEPCDPF